MVVFRLSSWIIRPSTVGCTCGMFPVSPSPVISSQVRYLSRMRTKNPRGPSWIQKLARPAFQHQAIRDRLEEQPQLRYEEIAPAQRHESSSVFYGSLVNKFTNMIMMRSEKHVAEEIMRKAFTIIKREQLEKFHDAEPHLKESIVLDPLKIFHGAVDNGKPVLILMPLRRGGITYQVPCAVTDKRAEWTSLKWIVLASRDNPPDELAHFAIAREILNAYHNEGKVIKRKYDLHRQCEANKAYAHYRWSR